MVTGDGEPIDYDQYAAPGVSEDPLVQALLTMPVNNRNEAGFMLHMAPKIAAHLRTIGIWQPFPEELT